MHIYKRKRNTGDKNPIVCMPRGHTTGSKLGSLEAVGAGVHFTGNTGYPQRGNRGRPWKATTGEHNGREQRENGDYMELLVEALNGSLWGSMLI